MVNELIYHQLNKHVKSLMHNYRKIVIKSYPDDKTIFCSLCVYCLPSFNDRIIFLKDPDQLYFNNVDPDLFGLFAN